MYRLLLFILICVSVALSYTIPAARVHWVISQKLGIEKIDDSKTLQQLGADYIDAVEIAIGLNLCIRDACIKKLLKTKVSDIE